MAEAPEPHRASAAGRRSWLGRARGAVGGYPLLFILLALAVGAVVAVPTTEAVDPPATTIFTPETEFGSRLLIEVVRGRLQIVAYEHGYVDRPRPAEQTYVGANATRQLSADLMKRIERLGAEAVTPPPAASPEFSPARFRRTPAA